MFRTKIFGAGLIIVGMLAARPAFADEDDDDMTPVDAKKMVKAMDDAKTTLATGIKVAEDTGKCKAVAAHGELEKDKMVVGVYCLAGEKLMDIDVDAKTGKVVESKEVAKKDEKGAKKDEDEDEMTPAIAKQMVHGLDEAKTTLSAAIKVAEDSSKGKAVLAHCEMEKGKLIVGVYCLAGEKLMDIDVDTKTGKVVESKEAGAHDDKNEKKEEAKPKKP
ncbi:MAG: hypothetical protein HY287_00535 [Planctomycetes bacterium]|nr:hypothetical protein [Planctomycetota bacterium]MBI3832799.1 hypothetical protein [Planctomycetota bacterium]